MRAAPLMLLLRTSESDSTLKRCVLAAAAPLPTHAPTALAPDAAALGYDADDRRWEGLMEEMAACNFEGEGGNALLASAIRGRLDEKPNEPKGIEPLNILAASAFNTLEFVQKGL